MKPERYLITQSLISSWAYSHDCWEGNEDDAHAEFMAALNRERREPTQAMSDGLAFEAEVYKQAAGQPRDPIEKWECGIRKLAKILKGAPVQVRLSREIEVDGMTFLIYGVLDALKCGTIFDVKYASKGMNSDIYGKYLDSPQHPFYFWLVPEAAEFQYLVSDGQDVYIETYRPGECRTAEEVIHEFIRSIKAEGLLDLYKEKWLAL